ncbi:MAG: radical SAM/SPASM domain-containing protein [Acidobacteriota bacterium]
MSPIRRYSRLARALLSYWRGRIVLDHMPIRMWIEPTNRCNLRCRVCPQSTPRQAASAQGMMDFDLYKKIIDEASLYLHDLNLFHTGESLLHRDIFKMIRYAKQKGLTTRLHTNGALLTTPFSEQIIDSGLDLLSFSFDGYDKETYESMRVRGNFDKTLGNIRRFLEIKKQRQSRLPYTIFEVMNIFQGARNGRAEFEGRFKGLPLDRFVVKEAHNWAGTYEVGGESGVVKQVFTCCTFPWYALVVFWDGRVDPCPQDFFGDIFLGDLTKQTIAEVWNGEPMLRLRRRMVAKNVDGIVPCETCDMLERESFLGVPTLNLKTFLKENLLGYRTKGQGDRDKAKG